jgi:hypothetical protein
MWFLAWSGTDGESTCECKVDGDRFSESCEKTVPGETENKAAATSKVPYNCPSVFVMVLQAGKVFLLAKYRDHDECAVRKRAAFVRICMVSGYGPLRGLAVYKLFGSAMATANDLRGLLLQRR